VSTRLAAYSPANSLGARSLRALRGRLSLYSCRQASMSCLASARVSNQWTLRHSSRKVPLKDSINALSVGLPREVDLGTALVGPQIHGLAREFAAIAAEQQFRRAPLALQSVQCSHHIFSSQALPHFDGYALPGKHVYDRQCAEAPPILQLICDEVDAPALARFLSQKSFFAMLHSLPPPRWPFLQGQAFFLVQPIDQVFAHSPAFAPQKNQNLPVSVTHPAPGYVPATPSTPSGGSCSNRCPHQTQDPAGMPLAGPILVAQTVNQWPAPRGLHHFYRSTS
jgi:hypothetical protein